MQSATHQSARTVPTGKPGCPRSRRSSRWFAAVSLGAAALFAGSSALAQTTSVPLTFQPDGDARFFEYFSDAFAQLDRGFNNNPALDGFYLISTWEASGGTVYQQVGGGFDVFVVQNPCPGIGCAEDNWIELGEIGYTGSGNGTFPVSGFDIEFNDVIPGNSLVLSRPYETEITSFSGTVDVTDGQIGSIDLDASVRFILDGSNFGEGLIPYDGTLEIANGRFLLDVDDSHESATGPYRVVWDVAGDVTPAAPPPTPGELVLSSASYSIDEDGGGLTVTVNRSGGSSGVASVDFATVDGTAVAPSDYQASSGTLNWADGDAAPKSFELIIVDDSEFEGDESFTIQLSSATGAEIGAPASATVKIIDNDAPQTGTLALAAASRVVPENAGSVSIEVRRSGGADGAVSVDFATADAKANASSDYQASAGTLSWDDGDTTARFIAVPIVNDDVIETSESLTVSLSNPVGAALGAPSNALVTILDDDGQLEVERINVNGTRDRFPFDLGFRSALTEARFSTSALRPPLRQSVEIPEDTNPASPFDGGTGVERLMIDVPAETLLLRVDIEQASAFDADLFVGRDLNGNGQAEESELVCSSRLDATGESCLIGRPVPGQWWVLAQNVVASSAFDSDRIDLAHAVLTRADTHAFGINGPGRHTGGLLEVQLFVDQPDLARDDPQWGAFAVTDGPDPATPLSIHPVEIERTAFPNIQSTALFEDETLPLVLAAGAIHDRLFFDVPPGGLDLEITVNGDSDVSGALRFTGFEDLAGAFPGSPPASGPSLDEASGSSEGFSLTRANPEPGRYFVELINAGLSERQVEVTARLTETVRQAPRFGLWSPRYRAINQGIEWQIAGLGFMIWYSYDSAGLPVFYIAINEIDPESSIWSADLSRLTGGVGNRQHVDLVGRVSLTTIANDRMVFSWRLNGAHGSDIMNPDAPDSCPELDGAPVSYTGHWFSPELNQGGTTVIVHDDGQFYVRYYFDGDGVGRWVAIVSSGPGAFADEFEVWSFQGFCPNCGATTPNFEVVGSYERNFSDEGTGTEVLDFVSRAPLNFPVQLEVPIEKLSESLPCNE